MASNFFKCESCQHEGNSSCFTDNVFKEYLCPECQSEDVFPLRIFRCKVCNHEGNQGEFFEHCDYDIDPLEKGIEGKCVECGCRGTTYK